MEEVDFFFIARGVQFDNGVEPPGDLPIGVNPP